MCEYRKGSHQNLLSYSYCILSLQEIQDNEQRNLLNVLASQTLSPVQELQKDDKLTDDEALQYVERVKKEMIAAKEKADRDRKKQEEDLHKKLSDKKKKRLEQKVTSETIYLY